MVRLALLVVLAACGRIAFDERIPGDGPTCGPEIDVATDPQHCGACGHDCLGGACTQGVCGRVQLATGQGDLRQVLVDATHVYWAGPFAIKRVAKRGGTPEVVAMFDGTGFRMTEQLGYLYWVTRNTGLVARAPKQANATAELIATGQGDVGGIASDGTTVYWNTYPTAGRIWRKDLAGLVPTELLPATDALTGMRLVGTQLYYLRERIGVFRIDTDGTDNAMVAPGVGTFEMAIDGDDLFVANAAATAIVRVSRATGEVAMVTDADGPWGIAVDATHVYFANEFGNTIARAPRGGGVPQSLTTAEVPVGVAVDDQAVYWTTRGGEVGMIAK